MADKAVQIKFRNEQNENGSYKEHRDYCWKRTSIRKRWQTRR